ncbi:endocuticle structural glycoprotein SgAbd-4-like [Agrilus planipennis]|uniref:Endocuticle structural glycoprotein SgAbd-4-like n=1 Tax=Agrilus planipennis TaxID=224129 RepID=A0A1W4XDH2_AGRPL|nr:endocuticle structural glycoprotein SgAbd-4-like [Agrilus planipennis]
MYTLLVCVMVMAVACVYGQVGRYRPIPAPVRPSGGGGPVIAILKQTQDINPDGSYQFSFETENGIAAQEQGYQKPGSPEPIQEAQGSFQYTAPDGTPINLQYISNEGGFQPQGNHLPIPPPTPPAILRALEWIAAHPEPEEQRRG